MVCSGPGPSSTEGGTLIFPLGWLQPEGAEAEAGHLLFSGPVLVRSFVLLPMMLAFPPSHPSQ